ncbi:MAG: FliI/YscN family ATPase [Phycisphaerales bacterium]|nr:FliI/YscN family ATPase [Phycisphaerales bacterium]
MARQLQPFRIQGSVAAVRGLTVLAEDLPIPVGSVVSIGRAVAGSGNEGVTYGEVVGFTREHSIIMLLGQTAGIRSGDPVVGEQAAQTVTVGSGLLGRCVDGLGRPIDGLAPILDTAQKPITPDPLRPMQRRRITKALHTGVRAIDLMTTLGRGQRMGIFAGPGVGKSTLLGTIARRTSADVNVIALIGERGREVKDFIEHALGPEGLARSVVVVATGDESPLMRIRSAKFACAAAEFFRDRGLDVMLMMDSVTRFAHAQRQVGLAAGEPPATKGYTPSVFAAMALLLERAGAVELRPDASRDGGSITGLYTILVEGDDMTEPVADAARGILDGHLILSRKLAHKAHFPAIDVLDSVSRVADDVTDRDHQAARRRVLRMLAVYNEVEDLVQIGAYARGSNPEADVAIEHHAAIIALLRQGRDEAQPFEASRAALLKLAGQINESIQRAAKPRAR